MQCHAWSVYLGMSAVYTDSGEHADRPSMCHIQVAADWDAAPAPTPAPANGGADWDAPAAAPAQEFGAQY